MARLIHPRVWYWHTCTHRMETPPSSKGEEHYKVLPIYCKTSSLLRARRLKNKVRLLASNLNQTPNMSVPTQARLQHLPDWSAMTCAKYQESTVVSLSGIHDPAPIAQLLSAIFDHPRRPFHRLLDQFLPSVCTFFGGRKEHSNVSVEMKFLSTE